LRDIARSARIRGIRSGPYNCGKEGHYEHKDERMTEITETDFKKEVLESKLPVFTCFTTRWCQPCYPTCLFGDELANEYEGRVKFVKVDVETIPHVSAGYHIIAVPTILIFKDSQLVKKLLGFQELRLMRTLLNSVVAESERLPGRRLELRELESHLDIRI
jgi:thioredoxin 1